MVSWSVYDCVATYTCERNSIQKHLYLFRIEPIKRYVTICGSIRLCISVCGCGYLSKENNEKTIRNVEQLTHTVMCGNMRWSFSFHLSVWMWIPVKRPQWRNNRNCCSIKPSRYVCQYVLLRFFVFECVDTDTYKLNAKNKQLWLLSISILFLRVCGYGFLWTFNQLVHEFFNRRINPQPEQERHAQPHTDKYCLVH